MAITTTGIEDTEERRFLQVENLTKSVGGEV
jgi:hypothetical protein